VTGEADKLIVIGGGLAGVEAAWQAAERGAMVELYEMRPVEMTPAHKTSLLAELVCSNSLRSDVLTDASGLLKDEMRRLGSLILRVADGCRVPAGKALAVDREHFAIHITELVERHPRIRVVRKEVTQIPTRHPSVVATGPLTSDKFSERIAELTEEANLYFHDAISPIVEGDSIDYSKTFFASRYDCESSDYLNCPFAREQYMRFWEALVASKTVCLRDFERERYFEGCVPVEELARRGRDTLAFGPLKPVGLEHPRTGERYYAVAQLRRERVGNELFNLVGFQTKMTYAEQKRVFRMIPGLEGANFARFGSFHRNTYINAPRLLRKTLQFRGRDSLFFAGQITGVEGYVESAATGMLCGVNAVRVMARRPPLVAPVNTAIGALLRYIAEADADNFQPANICFGLFDAVDGRVGRCERHRLIAERALAELERWRPLWEE